MNNSSNKNKMSKLLKLAHKFNSFYLNILKRKECCAFIVDGVQVGLIQTAVISKLSQYPNVFIVECNSVTLNPALRNYEERSIHVENVLRDMKEKQLFITLKGWRNECYDVRPMFSDKPLLKMDRSATCLFGICNYGVHINGFVNHPTVGLCIWLQQRSLTKQTWPGKWDNMVAGGLSVGNSVIKTAHKEGEEEASLTPNLLKNLKSAGTVSFFYESDRGLFPDTEFVFDLELPTDFVPHNQDNEVEKFELLTANETVNRILSSDFKTTSCPVTVDFLIRHAVITPENEPRFPELVELLHVPLQSLYSN
ncbi:uncharacterized protein LOC126901006 [Daktulosphaira vitifoliae]|uniref:uncharacterized protein LOC126901006 n=1 Tax=Daktulosphaira vitifoliae TaxID=58002 RepID=UPI0021AA3363|nr:uncharacterized protein LOC126901006 [Daktulosphaira vitifoliae]XP_050533050.1 uncharacterized protein LOC126901006 [Daktulosphaira vitifoliae]